LIAAPSRSNVTSNGLIVGFDPRSNASAGLAGRAVWAGDR